MTDRELLEKAAKAAGIELIDYYNKVVGCFYDKKTQTAWNPLTDDGDALRMAVRLRMDLIFGSTDGRDDVVAACDRSEALEPYGADPERATRRAIVRAAAALGG